MFLQIPPETIADRARFDAKWIETPEGCHRWQGFVRSKEYGGFQIGYHTYRAHRVAYVWAFGEVATDIHHTCENAWCVNPAHLTAVTIDSPQPHHRGEYEHLCAHGHEFKPENTYVNPHGERQCRTCLRAASRRHQQRNRERINAEKRAKRVRVQHEPHKCAAIDCDRMFVPIRASKTFCSSACYQRERNRRLRP